MIEADHIKVEQDIDHVVSGIIMELMGKLHNAKLFLYHTRTQQNEKNFVRVILKMEF